MDDDSRNRTNDEGNEEPQVYKVATSEGRRDFVRKVTQGVAVGTAVVAAGNCKKDDGGSPTKPSANTTSMPSTTTAPANTKWILHGYVKDSDSGKGVRDAKVAVLDGPNKDRSATTDGNGYFTMGQLEQSGFTIRITHPNYFNLEKAVNLVSDVQLDLSNFRPTTSVSSSSSTKSTVPSPTHYWYPC